MVNLRELFIGRQKQLATKLKFAREMINHAGDKGSTSENEWQKFLSEFLPERYRVTKATVIDSTGATSDSIDIVVYDRQFSPLVFEQGGFQYVAAEAVYAVFEVKQVLNASHLDYSGKKAASVRRLFRTSAPTKDIRGPTPIKPPIPILAGLLTTSSDWAADVATHQIQKYSESVKGEHLLELACVAESFALDIFRDAQKVIVKPSIEEAGLLFFLLSMLHRLQNVGTVAPIDFDTYRRVIQDASTS